MASTLAMASTLLELGEWDLCPRLKRPSKVQEKVLWPDIPSQSESEV